MVVKVLQVILVGSDFITGQVFTCIFRLERERARKSRVGGPGKDVGGVMYEYNIKSYFTHKGLILLCQEHYIPHCVTNKMDSTV